VDAGEHIGQTSGLAERLASVDAAIADAARTAARDPAELTRIVVTKFQDIAKAGAQVVKTDVPSGALPGFVDLGGKARKLPVTRLELVPPTFNPAKPDYAKLHAAVQASIAPTSATPAP